MTGESEVTLTWNPPTNVDKIEAYVVSVTWVQPSEDKAFNFEVYSLFLPDNTNWATILIKLHDNLWLIHFTFEIL